MSYCCTFYITPPGEVRGRSRSTCPSTARLCYALPQEDLLCGSMSLVSVYTYIHVYTHAHAHAHTCYICICIRVCVCVCMYMSLV